VTQAFFEFDPLPEPAPVAIPTNVSVDKRDRSRLVGQNLAVYERLLRGPATNVDLAGISLKYTSRISDVRAAGHRIDCERRADGVSVYTLVRP
jgi:hypothetical protein